MAITTINACLRGYSFRPPAGPSPLNSGGVRGLRFAGQLAGRGRGRRKAHDGARQFDQAFTLAADRGSVPGPVDRRRALSISMWRRRGAVFVAEAHGIPRQQGCGGGPPPATRVVDARAGSPVPTGMSWFDRGWIRGAGPRRRLAARSLRTAGKRPRGRRPNRGWSGLPHGPGKRGTAPARQGAPEPRRLFFLPREDRACELEPLVIAASTRIATTGSGRDWPRPRLRRGKARELRAAVVIRSQRLAMVPSHRPVDRARAPGVLKLAAVFFAGVRLPAFRARAGLPTRTAGFPSQAGQLWRG